MNNQIIFLPCIDSEALVESNRKALDIPRAFATELGQSAVEIVRAGEYAGPDGQAVPIDREVAAARLAKRSMPPDASLPVREFVRFEQTKVQVVNETTLQASRKLVERGLRPLALNFANGVTPGGGFLSGSKAQEEVLCRSSALYETLVDDPMYRHHSGLPHKHSSDWAILSPDVPVFRSDDGSPLEKTWLLSIITCAAPYCNFPPDFISRLVDSDSADLTYTALVLFEAKKAADRLRQRIHRILAIAEAHGYETLVLGAWGCGAFNNDPVKTASDFRAALENEFSGSFSEIVFGITDWSPERRFLGPFRDAFAC